MGNYWELYLEKLYSGVTRTEILVSLPYVFIACSFKAVILAWNILAVHVKVHRWTRAHEIKQHVWFFFFFLFPIVFILHVCLFHKIPGTGRMEEVDEDRLLISIPPTMRRATFYYIITSTCTQYCTHLEPKCINKWRGRGEGGGGVWRGFEVQSTSFVPWVDPELIFPCMTLKHFTGGVHNWSQFFKINK